MIALSKVTCPNCNQTSVEEMPEDACQFFWECDSCGKVIKPKPNDCCVYCSYGSVPCPSKQTGKTSACGKK